MEYHFIDQFRVFLEQDLYFKRLASKLSLSRKLYLFFFVFSFLILIYGIMYSCFQSDFWFLFVWSGVALLCLLIFVWRYARISYLQQSAFDFLLKDKLLSYAFWAKDGDLSYHKDRTAYAPSAQKHLAEVEKRGLRWAWNSLNAYLKDRFMLLIFSPLIAFVFVFLLFILFIAFFNGYSLLVLLFFFFLYLWSSVPFKYGLFSSDLLFFEYIHFLQHLWDRFLYYLSSWKIKNKWSLFWVSRLPFSHFFASAEEKNIITFPVSYAFPKGFYLKLTPQFLRRDRFFAFLKLFMLFIFALSLVLLLVFFIIVSQFLLLWIFVFLFGVFAISPLFDFSKFKSWLVYQKFLLFSKHKKVNALFSLDFHDCYYISTNDQILAHTFLTPSVKEVLMKFHQQSQWKYSFYLDNQFFYGVKHLQSSKKFTPSNYQNSDILLFFSQSIEEFFILSKVLR